MNPKSSRPTIATSPAPGGASRVRSNRPIVIGLAAVIAVAVGVVVVTNRSGRSSGGTANAVGGTVSGKFRFAVGEPGPGAKALPVVLPSTTGETFDLSIYRGKGVLLYFQEGIGCQPCWDQMRDYAAADAGFKAVGVDELVTITVNPVALLTRKMRQDKIGGIVLADTDLAVSKSYHANDYGMMGTSTDGHSFVFVDAEGTIRWRADYGGSPDFTMYVPPANLLADLRVGLGLPPEP